MDNVNFGYDYLLVELENVKKENNNLKEKFKVKSDKIKKS